MLSRGNTAAGESWLQPVALETKMSFYETEMKFPESQPFPLIIARLPNPQTKNRNEKGCGTKEAEG